MKGAVPVATVEVKTPDELRPLKVSEPVWVLVPLKVFVPLKVLELLKVFVPDELIFPVIVVAPVIRCVPVHPMFPEVVPVEMESRAIEVLVGVSRPTLTEEMPVSMAPVSNEQVVVVNPPP